MTVKKESHVTLLGMEVPSCLEGSLLQLGLSSRSQTNSNVSLIYS